MAEFSLVECAEGDKYLWNEFVARNPHSAVYHLWEWGDVLCRTYRHKRHYLAVKENKDILGVFPCVFVRSLIFGKRLISLPFVEYAGPLLKNNIDLSTAKSVLTRLLAYSDRLSRKLKADYTEIRQPPRFLSPMLPSMGFKSLQRHVTFRIDLTKEESKLWRDLKKKCRNSLRKAMKLGIKIEEVSFAGLKQYYDLYLAAQKRRGSPPHSFDFFHRVYDAFKPAGLLWMTLATYDDNPIAGVMVFSFKEQLYWFGNVTNRKYSSLNPTNLLLWHTIQRGIENNFRVFDLGQTREDDRGVYHFKKGWGGSETNLEDFVSSSRNVELPNPSQRKYVFLSRVWSMMPEALARRIGPKVIGGIGL
jgi:FemAB-related protein (PEP-CTERM system-associated)